MSPEEQAFALGRAWESLPEPKRQFVLQVVHPDGHIETFRIGPHTPSMKDEDVLLLHRLWLNITREPGLENVHHHQILTEALTRFAHDYSARERDEILKELRRAGGTEAARLRDGTAESRPAPLVSKESDDGPPTKRE
jgi:hypothetical protein